LKLSDLNVVPHPRGFQHKELFDNGYGVSVIPETDGVTYELAVLRHYEKRRAHLTYDTVITNDVIRYADVNAVDSLIEMIRLLPSAEE
jgi:hypothetical protein